MTEYEVTKLIYKLKKAGEEWLSKPEDELLFNITLSMFERLINEYHHSKEFEITNEWFIENIISTCDISKERRKRMGLSISSEEQI